MNKLTLKPGAPSPADIEKNNGGLTVRQKFSHGRTRSVTVVRKGQKPRSGSNTELQQADEAADLMTEIVGAMIGQSKTTSRAHGSNVEQHLARAAEHQARMKQEKKREREALLAIEKARAKKKARNLRLNVQRAATVAPPSPMSEPGFSKRQRKLVRQVSERRKDRIAQLAGEISRGKLPSLKDAGKELSYLEQFDTADWGERDRLRFVFVRTVLTAVAEGKMPQHIIQPDGKYFKWPGTDIGVSTQGGGVEAIQEIGVLKSVGYQVGLHGIPLHERRRLLALVFEKELGVALDRAYLSEWGRPGTSTRLRKLAHTIASLARNMKRRSTDAPSIDDWEADLAYLKQQYYVGRFDFPWPKA